MNGFGWGGISELSTKIGKSISYVSRRIRLLELPADIQSLISDSLVSVSSGEEMCSIKNKEKRTKIGNLIRQNHMTIQMIKELKSENSKDKDTID